MKTPQLKRPRSVDRVSVYFAEQGIPIDVKELPSSTRTAQLAAEAVGAALGSIVKSLVFVADHRTVLALVAGDQRADPEKIARQLGAQSVRIANAEEVRTVTSYAIGGVPPAGHPAPMQTLIDETLFRFDHVWAAAGAPNALFEIELKRLVEVTEGRAADIVVTPKRGEL